MLRPSAKLFIALLALFAFSCKSEPKQLTPREVLKAYTFAFKKKDAAAMIEFLSDASITTAKEESAAQGKTLDETILAETLLDQSKTEYKIRNEKIEGENASIEFQDSTGTWLTIPFIREDRQWKIAKEKFAEMLDRRIDETNRKLDEIINQGRYE